jgi:hypothetical protein
MPSPFWYFFQSSKGDRAIVRQVKDLLCTKTILIPERNTHNGSNLIMCSHYINISIPLLPPCLQHLYIFVTFSSLSNLSTFLIIIISILVRQYYILTQHSITCPSASRTHLLTALGIRTPDGASHTHKNNKPRPHTIFFPNINILLQSRTLCTTSRAPTMSELLFPRTIYLPPCGLAVSSPKFPIFYRCVNVYHSRYLFIPSVRIQLCVCIVLCTMPSKTGGLPVL